jgi:hypothetical protein
MKPRVLISTQVSKVKAMTVQTAQPMYRQVPHIKWLAWLVNTVLMVMDSAQIVILPVQVVLAALRLLSACAQPTSMGMLRMEYALLAITVVPLLLKRKAEEPPQLLHARVRPTRTAARRRACFVMLTVPVLPTAMR